MVKYLTEEGKVLMKFHLKYYLNGITSKIIIAVIVICIPIAAFSILSMYNNRNILIEQIKGTHLTMLQTALQQVDNEMTNARSYTNALTFRNADTLALTMDSTSSNFYYAANRLKNDVEDTIVRYQYIDGIFVCIPKTDFYLTRFNDLETKNNLSDFKQFLLSSAMPNFNIDSSWTSYRFNDTEYIIQGFSRNGIYAGCYINASSLYFLTSSDEIFSFLPYSELLEVQQYLGKNDMLLYQKSSVSDLCAYEIIDTSSLFSELPFIQRYIILVTIIIILFIPTLFFILNRIIIYPLKILGRAMNEIQRGNLDYRIDKFNSSNEYNQINHTFNNMVSQVNELKIAVYEEKLSNQKSRLNNLQIQLRPHFMINSLNMIFNTVTNQEQETSLKLIRFSIKYLRYMIKTKEDFVPLNEELEHIKNYLNIQLLRYSNHFSYRLDIDPFIETVPVPPLFIQNFIENSLKYSIISGQKAEIQLKINYLEKDLKPYLHILIRDNGNGYPEELLEPLNNQSTVLLVNKVGLCNSIERIKILYEGGAYLNFYNDAGAVSEFLFPMN